MPVQGLRRNGLPLVFGLTPITLFLLLRLGVVPDPQWVERGFHFYIVSFTAFVAAVVAIIIVLAASQVQHARVFFLGMAFLSISGIFFVHALTTPGFFVQSMNPWVTFSSGLSLLVGASFLVLSTIPAHPWVHRTVIPNQGGIPGVVLNKPGSLAEQEFRAVNEHPARGHQIIESVRSLQAEVSGIRHHHERLDGCGYPDGLASTEIPLIAVADVFDALTSERPYRPAYSVNRALEIVNSETPHKLDQTIVQALHATIRAGVTTPAAAVSRRNTGARVHVPAQPAAD